MSDHEQPIDRGRTPVSRTVLTGFDPAALIAAMQRTGLVRGDSPDVSTLARMSKVGVSTIRHWLSGARLPQVHQLAKVVAVLGIQIRELVVVAPDKRMLSYYRNILGVTQVELAAAAGMPTSTLSAIERGELLSLNDSTVTRLAGALRISESELRAAYRRTQDRGPGTPA